VAGAEDERTTEIPSRRLAEALSLAAGRTATALGAGIAPDPVDLDVIAANSRALIARARAAHPEVDWDDTASAPTATVLRLGTVVTPEPSRGASSRAEELGRLPEELRGAPPITRWDQLAAVLGEDWVAMAKDVTGADGPGPNRPRPGERQPSRDGTTSGRPRPRKKAGPGRPPRLTVKKARALLDTAELVKDENHRENNTWHLVAADGTVIGHVAPSYGGASRSGRNGWHGWAHGTTRTQDRHPTRDGAAVAASGAWLQAVTAKPHR
jgi:hypothetical protein